MTAAEVKASAIDKLYKIGPLIALIFAAGVAWGAADLKLKDKVDVTRFVADSITQSNDHTLLQQIDVRTKRVCEVVLNQEQPEQRALDCQ
jgi:hypothetical protein